MAFVQSNNPFKKKTKAKAEVLQKYVCLKLKLLV